MVLGVHKDRADASAVEPPTRSLRRRHRMTVLASVAVVAIMGTLTYYSAPLYRLFCQVTGFGGTTQVARSAPGTVSGPPVTVRFDANVASNLAWRFTAPQPMSVRPGEQQQVSFTAVNIGSKPSLGMAIYNVTPPQIGGYFYKIECFCFTEQVLEPGQTVDMPMNFFIAPEMADDRNARGAPR